MEQYASDGFDRDVSSMVRSSGVSFRPALRFSQEAVSFRLLAALTSTYAR
ncbi:hypothetical protein GRAN_4603 [Granulicella sibirica]|uniref:Uncharacterized protein n=1 Tax=Granulicella sibirica TaxID=2479048 RepID=A0A4Q0SUC3_9BACT|nr:hypothetical protein GRAN_4603 [Granulicella sibirica]